MKNPEQPRSPEELEKMGSKLEDLKPAATDIVQERRQERERRIHEHQALVGRQADLREQQQIRQEDVLRILGEAGVEASRSGARVSFEYRGMAVAVSDQGSRLAVEMHRAFKDDNEDKKFEELEQRYSTTHEIDKDSGNDRPNSLRKNLERRLTAEYGYDFFFVDCAQDEGPSNAIRKVLEVVEDATRAGDAKV